MELRDIHRTFHLKAEEYTIFSSPHGTFPRKDQTLGHKTVSINSSRLKSYQASMTTRYETRNQLQKEKWKKHKKVAVKQHATKNYSVNKEIKG